MFSAKFNEEKEALEEHKQKLKDIIDACKLLYDNFDEKRREVSIFYPVLNVMASEIIDNFQWNKITIFPNIVIRSKQRKLSESEN